MNVCGFCMVTQKVIDLGNVRFEYIVVKIAQTFVYGHCDLLDLSQGQSWTLKFFSIYHNTNCQVLEVNFGKS